MIFGAQRGAQANDLSHLAFETTEFFVHGHEVCCKIVYGSSSSDYL
jgi:hypothetical protein